MSVVFCAPKPVTILTPSEQSNAPAANLLRDEPARVWRSNGLSNPSFVAQLDGGQWDTFALVGNNLPASATIRLRGGSSAAVVNGSGAPLDVTFDAWAGMAPLDKATSFHLLESPVSHAFVRVDVSSPTNPDGYVQAAHLVIGKRVETDGVNIGAERAHTDGSLINDDGATTTIQERRRRRQWKVSVGPLTATAYYAEWDRFLYSVGKSRGYLYIQETDSPWCQSEAGFARNQVEAKSVRPSNNYAKIDLTLLEV